MLQRHLEQCARKRKRFHPRTCASRHRNMNGSDIYSRRYADANMRFISPVSITATSGWGGANHVFHSLKYVNFDMQARQQTWSNPSPGVHRHLLPHHQHVHPLRHQHAEPLNERLRLERLQRGGTTRITCFPNIFTTISVPTLDVKVGYHELSHYALSGRIPAAVNNRNGNHNPRLHALDYQQVGSSRRCRRKLRCQAPGCPSKTSWFCAQCEKALCYSATGASPCWMSVPEHEGAM